MSRVLIDTQTLIWLAEGSAILSRRAMALVDDPATTRLASTASIWELAIKMRLGKLILKSGTLRQFVLLLQDNAIQVLPITTDDALRVAEPPQDEHKDPFDRLLAAQCLRQDLTLVSIDAVFDTYGVRRVW